MRQEAVTLERILEKLDKGERIGLEEGIQFVQAFRKALGKAQPDALREATKKQVQRMPALTVLEIERQSTSEVHKPSKPLVYLNVPASMTLPEVCTSLKSISEAAMVGALSPHQILRMAASEKLKVLKVAERLAESGLAFVEGKLSGKVQDDAAVDEYFSTVMMLRKCGIKASAWLPIEASDGAKVRHLVRLREFYDRTQAFTFLFLHWEGKAERKNLLSTVALARVMLDNVKTIALSTYSCSQVGALEKSVLDECVELGVNQV